MQCVFDDGLAHHAGGSCRVLERVDGDVVCAAGAKAVLCGPETVNANLTANQIMHAGAIHQINSTSPLIKSHMANMKKLASKPRRGHAESGGVNGAKKH